MRKQVSCRAILLFPLALAFAASGIANAQPSEITPDMAQKAMGDQRSALQKQCPAPLPRVPESDEARYPIHVESWGGTGSKVLLIHGGVQGRIGGGEKTFDRQRGLSEMGWSVDRVSRPGFGASPSRGPDDMQADARALADLMKPGVNVIAHSWGGAEALLAVARQTDKVRSLILIEPAIAPTIGGPAIMADAVVAGDVKRRMLAQLPAQTPGEYARAFASLMGDMGSDGKLGPELAMGDDEAKALGCSLLSARMASSDDVLAAIKKVKEAHIPVLIVTGGWSPSFDGTGEVLAQLLGGRHVVVRSPNHFVQYSNAAEFNAVANDFMRSAR